MLDEANLRRLAEMGVDVYVPRVAAKAVPRAVSAVSDPARAIAAASAASGTTRVDDETRVTTSAPQAAVVLLADTPSASAVALIADVVRALKFARIACARGEARDETVLAAASALIMFGDRHARVAGALVPAQCQRQIGWIVSAELPALAVDASAKRALWSELKRMVRGLAPRTGLARR